MSRRETPAEAAVDYRCPDQVIDLILAVAFKHEVQYWRDYPGTEDELECKSCGWVGPRSEGETARYFPAPAPKPGEEKRP